jgi:hypothetical protein
MSLYSFVKRFTDLGVGTRDLGFRQFQTLPAGGSYLGPQWNIRRSLAPLNAPGFMILNGAVVPNTLQANGLGIAGQYVLQGLAQQDKSQ